jgi:hypothetical protein
MCIFFTMLMMISLLKSHAIPASPAPQVGNVRLSSIASKRSRADHPLRALMCTVILLGLCSLASSFVSAAYAVRTGNLCQEAALAWDSTEEGSARAASFDNAAYKIYETASRASSSQNICESLGVLLIAAAFVYGAMSILSPCSECFFRHMF